MIKKPVYDAKTPAELQRRHLDYNVVYNTAEGRRVLDDLLYFASIDRTAYNRDSARQTDFNLGKQSMGYHINAAIHFSFNDLPQHTKKVEDNNE